MESIIAMSCTKIGSVNFDVADLGKLSGDNLVWDLLQKLLVRPIYAFADMGGRTASFAPRFGGWIPLSAAPRNDTVFWDLRYRKQDASFNYWTSWEENVYLQKTAGSSEQ